VSSAARLWLHTLIGVAAATVAILPVVLRWRPLGRRRTEAPVPILPQQLAEPEP
jgi:hypothetical protein